MTQHSAVFLGITLLLHCDHTIIFTGVFRFRKYKNNHPTRLTIFISKLIQASGSPLPLQFSKQNPIHFKPFSTDHEVTSFTWKASAVTFQHINTESLRYLMKLICVMQLWKRQYFIIYNVECFFYLQQKASCWLWQQKRYPCETTTEETVCQCTQS